MIDPIDTATGMAAAVASGEASPAELVDRALDRLDGWQPLTNAFSQVYADDARALAAEAGRAISNRATLGPLHGVAVAVKDLFDMEGFETTGCCAAYAGNVAGRDADMVTRLRSAGAIVVGKTNQHELAAGATNAVSACGPTANPHDPARITGGSSGGSAAAVAAGVVPIALGSDTGGSIRMPSSMCGCWGLKPTTGRLSTAGMMPMAASLDCPGPMTATAGDLALAWRVLSGEDGGPDEPTIGRVGRLGGWFDQMHPETRGALDAAADAMRAVGAEVVAVDGEGIEDVLDVWRGVAWAELADAHGHLLERRELLAPRIARNLEVGLAYTSEQRAQARARATEIDRWFEQRLAGVDLLLAPTTPYPAPRADDEAVDIGDGCSIDVHRGGPAWFTEPANLAGVPALAAPCGHSPEGLPLSVQVIGKRGADAYLCGVACALERGGPPFANSLAGNGRGPGEVASTDG